MKIALICRIAWPIKGGLTWHALRLAQMLKAHGHEMHIFSRFAEDNHDGIGYFSHCEEERSIIVEGVPTHILGYTQNERRLMSQIGRLRTRKPLLPLAKALVTHVFFPKFRDKLKEFDVVHYDGGGVELMSYPALKAARHWQIPFIVQPSIHINQWGHLPIDHNLYRKSDAMFVHTEVEKQYLTEVAGCSSNQVIVVGNGIDPPEEANGERFKNQYNIQGRMILFLGRRASDKGYFYVHRAFEQIASRHPDVNMVFVGPRREDDPVFEIREDHPAKDRVFEIDFVPDQTRNDAIAACDFICLPSEGESFGLVFLEGGLQEKASIARNIDVLEELLGRFDAAYLIGKRKNNIVEITDSEVAQAMDRLLTDEHMLNEMASNAKQASQQHLWSNVVTNFIEGYKRLRS